MQIRGKTGIHVIYAFLQKSTKCKLMLEFNVTEIQVYAFLGLLQ